MTIKVGDTLPDVQVVEYAGEDMKTFSIRELFAGKKGILFGVPGAFTPGCSKTHLPGYIQDHASLKEAGAQVIACVSVNDPFVMRAWGEAHNATDRVTMLADVTGKLATSMGVDFDASEKLGNIRCQRFSMVIQDNIVKSFNLEKPGEMACSLSNQIVDQLKSVRHSVDTADGEMFDVMRRHWGY